MPCVVGSRALRCAPPSRVGFLTPHAATAHLFARVFPVGRLQHSAAPSTLFESYVRGISFGGKKKEDKTADKSSASQRPQRPQHPETEALPFRITQDKALDRYRDWARSNTPFTSPPKPKRLTSVFLPFWAFTADFYHPELPSHFGGCIRDVDGPTMQVYAGHTYPRAMVEVVKNSLHSGSTSSDGSGGKLTSQFSSRMLDIGPEAEELSESRTKTLGGLFDRVYNRSSRTAAVVDVEPFATYEATAWAVARAAYVERKRDLYGSKDNIDLQRARFDDVESYRVLLPCHIVEYSYLGQPFRVFINGYTGEAFGIQQEKIFADLNRLKLFSAGDAAEFFRRVAETDLGRLLPPAAIAGIVQAIGAAMRPLIKFLMWPPFFITAALTVGGYVAVKGTRSLRAQRAFFMEWEEVRKSEAAQQATMSDAWSFRPAGSSTRDRRRDAEREVRRERERQEEAERARRKAKEEEARAESAKRSRWSGTAWGGGGGAGSSSSSSSYQQQQQQQQKASSAGSGAKPKSSGSGRMPPSLSNAGDYYEVLGLKHMGPPSNAITTDDIQKAFRRELLKYHPDTNQGDGGFDLEACSERTRLIIQAYGTLRDQNKRKAYDATYSYRR